MSIGWSAVAETWNLPFDESLKILLYYDEDKIFPWDVTYSIE